MKKFFCTIILSSLACLLPGNFSLFAQNTTDAHRKAFIEGFEQLSKNSTEGLAMPPVKEALKEGQSKDGSGTTIEKFAIAPVTVATTPAAPVACNLGIKVWFSLEDGTCFNPVKRKMGVKEKFFVHIQSAVPVYVSLFQNYKDSLIATKQVYPDTHYPDSFKVVQAGVPTKLPVTFEMDDNTVDETMSMVVARADAPQIQATLSTQATTTVTNAGGTTVITARQTTATPGTLKAINDSLQGKSMDDPEKFAISSPAASTPVTVPATAPNDVAFYMLGAGYVGQWQLTLRK